MVENQRVMESDTHGMGTESNTSPSQSGVVPTLMLTEQSVEALRSEALQPDRRVGLTGGGMAISALALLTHAAFPVAVPALFVGGALFCAGLLARPSKELASIPKDDVNVTLQGLGEASEFYRKGLELTRSWMTDLQVMLPKLEDKSVPQVERVNMRDRFLRKILDDLTRELTALHDTVRACIWLRRDDDQLSFFIGSEIEDPGRTFSIGTSLMGASLHDGRIYNVMDAPLERQFEPTVRHRQEPFRGLLCVPLADQEKAFGVLCVDRTTPQNFSTSAENIAVTLSAVIVLVLSTSLPLFHGRDEPAKR